MIITCNVSLSSLLLNIPKAMAQPTRSSQRTSAEERDACLPETKFGAKYLKICAKKAYSVASTNNNLEDLS